MAFVNKTAALREAIRPPVIIFHQQIQFLKMNTIFATSFRAAESV